MTDDALEVSVVIVSFNTLAMTRACLTSVYEQTTGAFEVIVVDNASIDGSADMVATEFPHVELHRLTENVGFGRANNLAAAGARGARILLLNSDTVVLDRAIDRIVAFADSRPEAGVYGGRSVFADGSLNAQSCWGEPTLWSEFCQGLGLTAVFPHSQVFNPRSLGRWKRDTVREVDIVAGSFLLMDADLWRCLEGFDPRFFMYGEDIDLCMRARANGGRCLFDPRSEIIHHGGGSERVAADKMVKLLTAKSQLYAKHWSPRRSMLGVRCLDLWVLTRLVATSPRRRRRESDDDRTDWRAVWSARSRWRVPVKAA